MVVSSIKDFDLKKMESRSLKFGMDRILSEEISSRDSRSEEICNTVTPCQGCVSSLYRRYHSSLVLNVSPFYKSGFNGPQTFRSYTNESSNHINDQQRNSTGSNTKRKRSWSRAVFSNLQRKGLEKRFQLQKYITKPDRRQLAATLGLTDAQVKVWFQNRRMKWRHAKESSRQNLTVNDNCGNLLETANSSHDQVTGMECGIDVDVQTIDE